MLNLTEQKSANAAYNEDLNALRKRVTEAYDNMTAKLSSLDDLSYNILECMRQTYKA